MPNRRRPPLINFSKFFRPGHSYELGLQEVFKDGRKPNMSMQVTTFYETYKNHSPHYLYELLPLQTNSCISRSWNNISCFHFIHNFCKNSCFLSSIIKWRGLDIYTELKNLIQFIRPSPSSTHNCFNNKGIKHLTRLRLGFSQLPQIQHDFLNSFTKIQSAAAD